MRKISEFMKCSTHTVHQSILENMKPGKIEWKPTSDREISALRQELETAKRGKNGR